MPASYYAKSIYLGDGVTQVFSVPFPYLQKDHVKVLLNGLYTTAFTWLTDSTIQMSVVPAQDSKLTVKRETPMVRIMDFQNNSMLVDKNLDMATDQTLYVAQEMADKWADAIAMDDTGRWDAGGNPIGDIGDPTEPGDAINKKYADMILQMAQEAADLALAQAGIATNAKNSAEYYANLAQKWATLAEGNEVVQGLFSALHWAAKAQKYAEQAGARAVQLDAGVSCQPGTLLCLLSTGKYALADYNSLGTLQAILMATSTTPAGGMAQAIEFGTVNGLSGLTVGQALFAGPAGTFTQEAPTTSGVWVKCLGWAKTASSVQFRPDTISVQNI